LVFGVGDVRAGEDVRADMTWNARLTTGGFQASEGLTLVAARLRGWSVHVLETYTLECLSCSCVCYKLAAVAGGVDFRYGYVPNTKSERIWS
jgi:hypothetical protein